MQQYKAGIGNSAFYNTDVVIASSTNWKLTIGAEDATLMGVDLDDTPIGQQNTMDLDNIGFMINSTGANGIASTGLLPTGMNWNADFAANGLGQFNTATDLEMSATLGSGAGNGGDITKNKFTINWECGLGLGTGAGNLTNGASILSQNIKPDRYVTNILLYLEVD